jgi:hypothetical protein
MGPAPAGPIALAEGCAGTIFVATISPLLFL